MNRPLERSTKWRRLEQEAEESDGNGRGTASAENDQEEEDDDHNDDDDKGDGANDGHENMMWERDGFGYKSMPMFLATVARLYVSVISSFVGTNKIIGVLDLPRLLLLLLMVVLVLLFSM